MRHCCAVLHGGNSDSCHRLLLLLLLLLVLLFISNRFLMAVLQNILAEEVQYSAFKVMTWNADQAN